MCKRSIVTLAVVSITNRDHASHALLSFLFPVTGGDLGRACLSDLFLICENDECGAVRNRAYPCGEILKSFFAAFLDPTENHFSVLSVPVLLELISELSACFNEKKI